MHKIKVQSVTFKMPYLEANKTKLFLGVGKQFSNTTVEHLFFNHTEPRGIEQAKQKIRESKKCASGMRFFEMLRRETQQEA